MTEDPSNMSRTNKGSSSTAFLNKLWRLVNDSGTDNLIKWSMDGSSFIITNSTSFSQELLPKYYKHNNMASFIRQLNLYGFRKVPSIEAGGLSIDKGEIEFSHPKFIRGLPNLIEHIKRKPQGNRVVASTEETQNLSDILNEVQTLKRNQNVMIEKMNTMKKENDDLWRGYSSFRQKLSKQQLIIEKLVQFLLSLVKSPGGKWKFNHLALENNQNSAPKNIGSQNKSLKYESVGLLPITGPKIHEVTHLDEDKQTLLHETVSQYSSDVNSVSNKLSQLNKFSLERNAFEPACKAEAQESIVLVEDFADGSDPFVPDTEPDMSQIFLGNNTSAVMNVSLDFDPLQLITDNKSDSNSYPSSKVITVQSPDGTFLHTDDDSPPLSPDLLQTVDPSVVNPNIVVNIPSKNQQMTFKRPTYPPSYTPSSSGGKKGMGSRPGGKLSNSFDELRSVPNYGKRLSDISSNINKGPDFLTTWNSTGSSVNVVAQNTSQASNIARSKNGKLDQASNSRSRQGKTLTQTSINTNDYPNLFAAENRQTTSTGFDVAVPEKSFEDELISGIDKQEYSINSLRDMLSLSNFNINVDIPTLLSFLENDEDQLASTSDLNANDSDALGNEVTVYNPSLYDITAEDDSDKLDYFNSFIDVEGVSPTKKMKLNSPNNLNTQDGNDDEEGFTTPQPYQLPFNFKP